MWILVASPAWAQSVALDFDPGASGVVDTQAVESAFETAANDALRLVEVQDFLDAMADASAMSTRGLGVDYGNSFDGVLVGGGVGTTVSGVGLTFGNGEGDLPELGFAAQLSAMVGVNLGLLDRDSKVLPHLRLYGNGLYAPLPSGTPFDGLMYNGGAHLQLGGIGQIAKDGPVNWGGLDLTGGIELSHYALGLGEPLLVEGADAVRWDADGRYDLDATALVAPVDLSTSFRVLVATVWLGGGYDLNLLADTHVDALLTGPVDVAGDPVGQGTANLSGDRVGAPDRLRLFAGAQVSLWMVRALAQLNVGLDDTYGGQLGLRVAL